MKSLLNPTDKTTILLAIGKELYASNLYKDIANKLQKLGYFGAQKYFLKESEDELKHYQLWVDFCNDMLDVAEVPQVQKMTAEILSLRSAFDLALKTEIELGEFYKQFRDDTEDCYVGQRLLEFIEIQRTSIGEYGDFVARLELCGVDRAALLQFDKEFV